MILSLKIALHFHRSFKKSIFISLISLISILVISVGVFVSIIVLSLIHGFKYELSHRILSVIPHGEIIPYNMPFIDWKIISEHLKKIPNVIQVNPCINFFSVVEYQNRWRLAYIKTINLLDNTSTYSNILNSLIEKKFWKNFCQQKNQIILGQGMSIALNAKEGDWINIFFSNNNNLGDKLLFPQSVQVQVSGILNINSQLDDNLAIISLANAQHYYNNRLDVDKIEFSVNDVFLIKKVVQRIEQEVGNKVKIRSWIDLYGYIYHDIQVVRLIIYLSMILIISIACISMITTLILSIKYKSYDIAILKSMGAQNILIQYVFLWYGFIICGVASIIGIFLGIFLSLNLVSCSKKIFTIFGKNLCLREVYFIDFIPCKLYISDVFIILMIVFMSGILSSWYASLRINRIDLSYILK